MVRDGVITTNNIANKGFSNPAPHIPPEKDSFKLSSKDISSLVSKIKANNITDINAIKDIATFSGAKTFNVNHLSDHQISKLVSAVRNNIAENVAELIYNTKTSEKLAGINAKEKAHIDRILANLRQSNISDLNQAVEFVKSQSADNPNLLSKISGRLINIVNHSNNGQPQTTYIGLARDSYTPAVSIQSDKFINPFKSDTLMRSDQPRNATEAKEFLSQLLSGRNRITNPQATNDISNLILASYLRGDRTAISVNEEMLKGNLKQLSSIDKMTLQDQVLHKNVSYINDIAAKIASEKARVIIICRLAGEIAFTSTAALSVASLVGTSPLIGILGGFALTLIAAIAGFIIGKAAGDGIGRIITNTAAELITPEEQEAHLREINLLEEERKKKQEAETLLAEEIDDIEDNPYIEGANIKDFALPDYNASETLKTSILFKKKPSNV
jgi:hypothetical protein